MKQILFILLLLFLIILLFLYLFKCHVVKKVCRMTTAKKLNELEQLTIPFGFEYKLTQDIFTSRLEAWQRDYGYCSLYDRHAVLFHMIFDCEPIYFDYDGATWLIEFWKGQYGIATGAEIGIYKADRIISKKDRTATLFRSVSDNDMPFLSFTLLKDQLPICRLCRRHWWLTGFSVGQYSEPEDLTMKIAANFSSEEMCQAFFAGLLEAGYLPEDIYIQDTSLAFTFDTPHSHSSQPRLKHPHFAAWMQRRNRLFLSLFVHTTKPFCFTIDRLLLLYKYLPFVLRRLLKLRHIGRKRRS